MAPMAAYQPYKLLAKYYDDLFTFHARWFRAARKHILADILTGVESACDLACGTGTTAVALASKGIRMYGVDVSPAMCRMARQKAREANVPLRVLRADMREFELPRPVDLVLCEFDAINHVPEKADLARVVGAVARALRPGGHFYFDVNNLLAFEKVWPGTWFIEKPDVALVMHGGYDRPRKMAWTDAEWFIRRGQHWRRYHEHFEQVCWTATEIRRTLAEAGFGKVRAWDAAQFFKDEPLTRPGCRTFYLGRKK